MAKQAKELRYSVRPRVVAKYLGQLLLIVAALSLAPLAVAVAVSETGIALRLALVISILTAVGWVTGRQRVPAGVRANEAMVVTASVFLASAAAMVYPVMGAGLGFSDALFEAVSGVTTTGLSTLATVADKPTAFLFLRAWMQWYGGLGIGVLSLALVVPPGLAAKGLAAAEEAEEDLVGGTKAHARRLLVVYSLLTVAGILGLWVLAGSVFDAVVYTLAAVSTGGFSPHDQSLAGLGAWPTRWAVILLCFAGAVPLAAYHRAWASRTLRPGNLEAWGLTAACVAVSAGLCGSMAVAPGSSWQTALRHGPLLAFSAQTTAGFSTLDPAGLDGASKLVVILAMAVGGGIGSTAGGFKILRLLVFLRLAHLAVVRTCLPRHALLDPHLGGRRLGEEEARNALLIMLIFLAVIGISWLPFLARGYEPLGALFEVVSATGTVGLSVGVAGPGLPVLLKAVLCADMLLGRLEVVAWLVVLAPGTWVGRKGD